MEKPTIVTPPVTPPMTPPATPPPQIPRPVSGGGSGGGGLKWDAVIEAIATRGHDCALKDTPTKFTTQSAKKIDNESLKQTAFIQGVGGQARDVTFILSSGWQIIPGHNALASFGSGGDFTSNGVKNLRRLFGLSRIDQLMMQLKSDAPVSKIELLFKEYKVSTPPSSETAVSGLRSYFLVSTRLLDSAIGIAKNPNVFERIGVADEVTKEDRIERLVMASAAASTVFDVTGIRLPDLTNLLDETSVRNNGVRHFNAILGHVIDAFDAISVLVESPTDLAAKKTAGAAIESITCGYDELFKESRLE
jgi:hypothetical protein